MSKNMFKMFFFVAGSLLIGPVGRGKGPGQVGACAERSPNMVQGHRYGKKPGDKEYYIAHQLKKKLKKKNFLGIHDRFIRDEKFRKNMFDNGRTEDVCRQVVDLADEDHTHHLTPQEVDNYKSNWWIRSNKIGSDTMPILHRSDFKQALSTLRQLKEKEEEAQRNQRCTQSYSSSWWSWQGRWWTPYSYESHHGDVPNTA